MLIAFGGSMVIPVLIDLYYHHPDWRVFAASAVVTVLIGTLTVITNLAPVSRLSVRQASLMTVIAWLALTFFGALPFLFTEKPLNLAGAVFESISGLTTTGATVMVGLDTTPPGILMWRAILHGIGGIGIVLMAIAILPFLRVGGMQMFRLESSDKAEKVRARMAHMVGLMIAAYGALILVTALALDVAGMSMFDAFAHAISAVATGGFSTKDASIGFYANPAIEYIIVMSMLASALPLTWYVRIAGRQGWRHITDSQVIAFFRVIALCVLGITLWLVFNLGFAPETAFRYALFHVASVMSTTGFVATDYSLWGHFAMVAFVLICFIGGCTGSTAGGIKIFRWQILARYLRFLLVQIFQPHRAVAVTYQGRPFELDVVLSVMTFIAIYLMLFGILTMSVALTGVDLVSASSGVAACMANSGPGVGPIVGPAGTYAPLPDSAKWLLSLAMVLGRLEIFTLLVLLTPDFWQE